MDESADGGALHFGGKIPFGRADEGGIHGGIPGIEVAKVGFFGRGRGGDGGGKRRGGGGRQDGGAGFERRGTGRWCGGVDGVLQRGGVEWRL